MFYMPPCQVIYKLRGGGGLRLEGRKFNNCPSLQLIITLFFPLVNYLPKLHEQFATVTLIIFSLMSKGSYQSAATVDVWISQATLVLSSTTAALLPYFPVSSGAAGIPDELLSTDNVFVVSVLFAFTCSFSAVILENKPRAARVFRLSAVSWLSSAAALLLYTVFSNCLAY